MPDAVERYVLPDDVVPSKYKLDLAPDLNAFTYTGTVVIDCEVRVSTEKVVLNAKDLTIDSAVFQSDEAGDAALRYEADEISCRRKDMTVTFTFSEVLPVGLGKLTIKFGGILNDQMKGFYRSQYTDMQGNKQFMATTHFEPIDARRCFPCWDEPARKAVFEIDMTVAAGLTAISCMPEASSATLPDGRRRISFLPTPKMSSYIVAFCVGQFDFLQSQSADGTLVRVLSCPGRVEEGRFALKCAVRAVDYFSSYFGTPYPLPKMDLIAIPDFPIGAMENWGLLTYRADALLCQESSASTMRKQRICSIVSHEISHMWFGNLVTPDWWDDLWLKEGFANFMETFCSDHLYPDWHVWEGYVGVQQQRALSLDALRSSHPVEVPIHKAEEVEEVFDAISYAKGGSIVRMAYAILGDDAFRAGLQAYFKKYAYSNTKTVDLWQEWQAVSDKPLASILGSWTSKMGFPMLRILGEGSLESGEIEVEQQWFLADGSRKDGDEEKLWSVPILMQTSATEAPGVQFLHQKREKIKVPKGAQWLKLNAGQHVPCRVAYPPALMKKLCGVVTQLDAEDRIGLLSDALALCEAAQQPVAQVIELLKQFGHERNDKVWAAISAVLGSLNGVFKRCLPADAYAAFRKFALDLALPCAEDVGWVERPGDDDNVGRLRQTMAGLMSSFGNTHAGSVAAATEQCRKFLAGEAVSQNVRAAALGLAVSSDGTGALFRRLIDLHDSTDDGAVQTEIYGALAAAPTTELKKQALRMALTPAVRPQDMQFIPAAVSRSGLEGPELVLGWMQEHFSTICTRLPAGGIPFQRLVQIAASGFASSADADSFKAFWMEKPLYSAIKKTVDQAVEGIRARARFADHVRASGVSFD
eukprot:TRINITY_DN40547_c0_g1_i1.p1 TRINITY_DN40547_c0_g1~~TRINITY_DN40547_c0_g1_i1.p1  ORF type:complete len:870 (-),score=221.05 TRINITY_DN40547_c0_g1_i1:33-2642(-)